MSDADLEQRVRHLEDVKAIENLMSGYANGANIVDGKSGDLKAFAALFADDADWDVGMGSYIGPAAIEARMREITTQWHVALHLIVNPLIEVQGDRAKGKFTGVFPFLSGPDAKPIWMANFYHNTFVRTAAGWRFQSVKTVEVFRPVEFDVTYAEELAAV